MRIKEGFVMRSICGVNVLSAEGSESVNFCKMISLNDSAAYLFSEVQDKEFDAESLADLLVEKYEIDRETALTDSKALCEKWIENGVAQ